MLKNSFEKKNANDNYIEFSLKLWTIQAKKFIC